MVEVFHTSFGVAGEYAALDFTFLSILIQAGLSPLGFPGLVDLDPVCCMPASIIETQGLHTGWEALERRKLE